MAVGNRRHIAVAISSHHPQQPSAPASPGCDIAIRTFVTSRRRDRIVPRMSTSACAPRRHADRKIFSRHGRRRRDVGVRCAGTFDCGLGSAAVSRSNTSKYTDTAPFNASESGAYSDRDYAQYLRSLYGNVREFGF